MLVMKDKSYLAPMPQTTREVCVSFSRQELVALISCCRKKVDDLELDPRYHEMRCHECDPWISFDVDIYNFWLLYTKHFNLWCKLKQAYALLFKKDKKDRQLVENLPF